LFLRSYKSIVTCVRWSGFLDALNPDPSCSETTENIGGILLAKYVRQAMYNAVLAGATHIDAKPNLWVVLYMVNFVELDMSHIDETVIKKYFYIVNRKSACFEAYKGEDSDGNNC
jgi:hypothetical protein